MRRTSDPSFPQYLSEKNRFLELAQIAGLSFHSVVIDGKGGARGWQGEELCQNFAFQDQGSEITLVHMSGVHGIEGYLGSSIQQKILATCARGLQDSNINLLFIHAVNPFGMSWYRRFNDGNVDLNRNGLPANHRVPDNQDVKGFETFLQSSSRMQLLRSVPGLLREVHKIGFSRATQAIGGGQWSYPDSIFYGGREWQPEIAHLPRTLLKLLPSSKRFYFVDVHTGLGPSAYDSLLISQASHLDFFRQALRLPTEKKSHVVDTSPQSEGQLYLSQCTLEDFLREQLGQLGCEVAYLTQEFGTLFFTRVLTSLILENSLYHSQPKDPSRPDLLLRSFFPDSPSWLQKCRQKGFERFTLLLQSLSNGTV